MISIILVSVLDSKIIDCETEDDGVAFVAEKAWCGFCGMAAGSGQAWQACVVGDSTGLGWPEHAFQDFNANMASDCFFLRVVKLGDDGRDNGHGNFGMFFSRQDIVEEDIFDVCGHESGSFSGDDAVEQKF